MTDKTHSIQVIDRLAGLLDALAAGDGPVSLKILSAETGLHPSTAFRILAAAGSHGFVARDADGRYRLGAKLIQLGAKVGIGRDLRQAARDVMEALRDEIDETVNLTVREGDQVVYVERVTARRMMRVEQVIGSRAPLHVTAVGKLMLGEEGAEGVLAYAERTGLPRFTEHTFTAANTLRREVAADHAQGYALDNEEAELGVGCIGVLIRDHTGCAVGGLSVSAPLERRSDAWIEKVVDAGARISERLGYRRGSGTGS